MNIERILRDAGGTRVRLGATQYHFRPEAPEGPHVATVEDEAHQRVFLSIPEGYRTTEAPAATPKAATAAPAPAMPAAAAEPAATATADDDAPDTADLSELSDEALRAVFKETMGRAAPPKSKPGTMIAQILAKREEDATGKED